MEPQVPFHVHPHPPPEALAVALHLADSFVEEDPLDAEEGDEHRRETQRLTPLAHRLGHPVVEARDVDAAQHHSRHAELLENPPELLGRIDQMDDHQRAGTDHPPCSPSESSSSTPPALLGWTNCTQQPPAPRVGSGRST